jgi:rhamnopyranosyl-N-acetylglucosaminyl-diphospho-decaprenol beta-1,3/1,4-galactofuranosyltransferase
MRVLAHVHTFNDAEVIEQALDALRRQTRPPDAILIVDNASTDGTLDRIVSEGITVIRNSANLGSSGAVGKGFTYAIEQEFDWAWILDADSVPEPDALENLLGFYEHLPLPQQEHVSFLACRLAPGSNASENRPILLTRSSIEFVSIDDDVGYCRCDCFIWSGALFRMAAVAKTGLPSADYFIDLSELEYGYRAQQLGLTGYIVNSGLLHQDVGRCPGVSTRIRRIGPLSFRLHELSPLRCYYHVRNLLYFWLYQCRPYRPFWICRSIVHGFFFPRTFAIRPFSHSRHLIACLRGLRDGLTGHIERRY